MNDIAPVDDPSSITITLAEHAAVIRTLGKRVVHDIVEIGRRLAACKDTLPHGHWLPWLEHEFGWDERSAQNYISAYELADKYETVSDLNIPVRGLYLLARPSTPEEARSAICLRSGATTSGKLTSEAQAVVSLDCAQNRGAFCRLQSLSSCPSCIGETAHAPRSDVGETA